MVEVVKLGELTLEGGIFPGWKDLE